MEEKEHIGVEIKRLDNEIHSRMAVFRAENGADDLTMMQSWIIGFLYDRRNQEIFQKDIEAEFSIARSTATGILQLMEKKGYIHRQCPAHDARMKRLTLTKKGIMLQESIIHNIEWIEEKLREGISREDLNTFFRVIRKMRFNVEQDHCETDRRRDRC
ncbi:MAG: MarR family winged helix-turn-helix transcriptional regulator [Oliverpabstia sp.]